MQRQKILRFESTVTDIQQLTDDVKHIVLEKPHEFSFIPGQFITFILHKDGEELRRSYSIASKNNSSALELCIKIVKDGRATSLIDRWNIGEKINVIGPLGHFVVQDKSHERTVILIATGTGVTPFRPMVHHLLENHIAKKVILIAGYKNEKDILYDNEFRQLAETYPHFLYKTVLSRSEKQEKQHVQDVLETVFMPDADYYICGLKEMVFSVRDLLMQKGILLDNLFFERYD